MEGGPQAQDHGQAFCAKIPYIVSSTFATGCLVDDITIDFVQQALRHVKMKQTEMSHSLSKAESVLSAVTMRNKPRGPPTCVKCAEVGHICHYCTSKKSKGQKTRLAEGQDVRMISLTGMGCLCNL